MSTRIALAVLLACGMPSATHAQTAAAGPATAPETTAPAVPVVTTPGVTRELAPFTAQYEVLRAGRRLGAATLRLVRLGPTRWRVDLAMRGTGLVGLAGLNAEQATVFDADARGYRPVSQATRRSALFTKRASTGLYDWSRMSAQWSGDVKPSRRAPVALRDGDMSGLLINLAIVRDAVPGARLAYRFVDDGRVREHRYVVSPATETVVSGDLRFDAMRVERSRDAAGGEDTVVWVADGVPTPIRMLQREDGVDTFDLRLLEYKGA